MDAAESATATAEQQPQQQQQYEEMATVHLVAGGSSESLAASRGEEHGRSNVNNDTTGSSPAEQPTSCAQTADSEEVAESCELVVVVTHGEDSQFDLSPCGNGGDGLQPPSQQQQQQQQQQQFSDQMEEQPDPEPERENDEGTQLEEESLVFITALVPGGAALTTVENTTTSTSTNHATTTTTTTTTTTPSTIAKKSCPLETVEVAALHNTLATVVGDHGATDPLVAPKYVKPATPSSGGEQAPQQQVVYVRSSEDAQSTQTASVQQRCNVLRIQILPADDGTACDVVRGVGDGRVKCASAKVTVVSFGGDDHSSSSSSSSECVVPGDDIEEPVQQEECEQTRVLPEQATGEGEGEGGKGELGAVDGEVPAGADGDARRVPEGELAAVMVQKKSEPMDGGVVGGGATTYVYYLGPRPTSSIGGDGSGGMGSSSSGQCSPSDMLDSGTCSDIELTPPPLPKKMSQLYKASSAAPAAPAVAIKRGPGSDKVTTEPTTAVINQAQAADTAPFHQLEFHRLHRNQVQQHEHQLEAQHLRDDDHDGDDDDDDDDDDEDDEDEDDHHLDEGEEQDGQNGEHQTSQRGDLTQNGFAARQQQKQLQVVAVVAESVIVTDSDGSESCLSCDSLNFESHLQQEPSEQAAAEPDAPIASLRVAPPPRLPPYLLAGNGVGCGLPDSLLAAIRESRPKVYCTGDEEQKQERQEEQRQHYDEPVTVHRNGTVGHAPSVVEQLELLMPASTTTRSILMDKINSLEQAMQERAAVRDQPEQDASSNHHPQQAGQPYHHHHHHHHAINSEPAGTGRAQSSCSTADSVRSNHFESDRFYKFHIHEHAVEAGGPGTSSASPEAAPSSVVDDDESFAGLKDLANGTSTIRSNKGTVRGVKNRVRNGIATFLQMQQTGMKNYKDKEAGKVVVYSTSMGIVRETYTKCMNVKQILRTLLIKFEEKDIFMSSEYQQEIRERMQLDTISIPQVFVDGQHIGDAECIERLNESGELRKMLKPYKCLDSPYMCKVCGGYRLLPCPSCGGSKKSIHRNHFTAEFVALKCMNCDEVGLVKCHNC